MLVGERWASSSLSTQVCVDPRTLQMSGAAGGGGSSPGSESHPSVPLPQQASARPPHPCSGSQRYSHMRSRSQRASHLSFISFLL